MPQARNVLLLGYGEMGHAMEYLLAARHRLRVWQRRVPGDLLTEVSQAEIVIFCVPAPPHAELATQLRPALPPQTLCLTVAKGLDDQARTAAEVFGEVFAGKQPCAALCGPMIAEEIRAGKPAFAQVGCAAAADFERVQALFHGSPLALEHSRDVAGLAWCAVLKNVYAMLFGMCDGLALGDNMRGWLTVAALREMTGIVTALGAEPVTPWALAGLGDLVTTATSRGSHHHELGLSLARGTAERLRGEGIHALAALRQHPRFDPAPFRLWQLIDACARQPPQAAAQLRRFTASLTH